MAQLGSAGALGALGRRFESCRPDQSETGFPACLFLCKSETGISAGSPEYLLSSDNNSFHDLERGLMNLLPPPYLHFQNKTAWVGVGFAFSIRGYLG